MKTYRTDFMKEAIYSLAGIVKQKIFLQVNGIGGGWW